MTNREYIESFNDEAFFIFMSWFGKGEEYICPNYTGRDTDYKKIVNWYGEKYDENSDFWQFIQPTIDKVSNWNKRNMNNKWIPVSERLPEKDGSYLVSRYFDKKVFVNICEFKSIENNFYIIRGFEPVTDEILAWMELPTPYEKPTKEVAIIFEIPNEFDNKVFFKDIKAYAERVVDLTNCKLEEDNEHTNS